MGRWNYAAAGGLAVLAAVAFDHGGYEQVLVLAAFWSVLFLACGVKHDVDRARESRRERKAAAEAARLAAEEEAAGAWGAVTGSGSPCPTQTVVSTTMGWSALGEEMVLSPRMSVHLGAGGLTFERKAEGITYVSMDRQEMLALKAHLMLRLGKEKTAPPPEAEAEDVIELEEKWG